jgi:tRNA U34 5-carboxymethylaminomethyl modifying GTPase MnmE/TrmE
VQVFDITGQKILEETVAVNDMGVVHWMHMPAGFTGAAIIKVNVNGTDYTRDISIQ